MSAYPKFALIYFIKDFFTKRSTDDLNAQISYETAEIIGHLVEECSSEEGIA